MSEKEEDKIQQLVDVTQRTSSLTAFSHSVFTEEGLISSEGRSLTVDSDYFELEREIEQLKNARQFREGRKEELFRKEGRLLIEAVGAEIKVSQFLKNGGFELEIEQLRRENSVLRARVAELQGRQSGVKTSGEKANQQQSYGQRILSLEVQIDTRDFEIERLRQALELLRVQKVKKDDELSILKAQVQRYVALLADLGKGPRKQIREVPVYIQKQMIVEVPVPIYINQKQQKMNARFMPLVGSSAEENSIAVGSINESIEIEDKSQQFSPDKNKLGMLCRSIAGSNVSDDFDGEGKKQMDFEHETRKERIKEIVEVPVYIVKEVVREVEKIVIKEVQVIVEKEVIRYVEPEDKKQEIRSFMRQDQSQHMIDGISQRKKSNALSDEFNLQSPRNMELLLQSNQKKSEDGSESWAKEQKEEKEQHKGSKSKGEQILSHQTEQFVRIDEQSVSKEQQLKQSNRVHEHSHQRVESEPSLNRSTNEIIMEVPVEVEKIVEKEVLLPVQIPVQIIVEVDRIREIVIQKPVVVIKEIYIQRKVEGESIILPVEIPVQIFIEKIQRVETVLPVEIPVEILLADSSQRKDRNEVIERAKEGQKVEETVGQLTVIQSVRNQRQEVEISRQIYLPQSVLPKGDVEIIPNTPQEKRGLFPQKVQKQQYNLERNEKKDQFCRKQEKSGWTSERRPQNKNIVEAKQNEQPSKIDQRLTVIEVPTEINIVHSVELPTEIIIERQVQQEANLCIVEIPNQIIIEREVQKDANIQILQIPSEIIIQKIVTQEAPLQIVEVPTEIIVQRLIEKEDGFSFVEVPVQIMIKGDVVVQQQVVVENIIIEVPVEIEIEREVLVERVVEKEVIKEVVREVPKMVEVIKQVPNYIEVIKHVRVQVPKQVVRQVQVTKQVVIEKQKIVEIVREIPIQIPIERVVEKQVEKPIFVEKEKPIFVEREKIVYRDVPVQVIKREEVVVEVIKPVQIYVDRVIEKEVVREVEKLIVVEVPVEIIKERVVEKIVYVERADQVLSEGNTSKLDYSAKKGDLNEMQLNIVQIPTEIILRSDVASYNPVENGLIRQQLREESKIQKELREQKIVRQLTVVEIPTEIVVERQKIMTQIVEVPMPEIVEIKSIDSGFGFSQVSVGIVQIPTVIYIDRVIDGERKVQAEGDVVLSVSQKRVQIQTAFENCGQKSSGVEDLERQVVKEYIDGLNEQMVQELAVSSEKVIQGQSIAGQPVESESMKNQKKQQQLKRIQESSGMEAEKEVASQWEYEQFMRQIKAEEKYVIVVDSPSEIVFEKVVEAEKIVDRVVEVVVQKPVEKIIERIQYVEVPVQIFIEKKVSKKEKSQSIQVRSEEQTSTMEKQVFKRQVSSQQVGLVDGQTSPQKRSQLPFPMEDPVVFAVQIPIEIIVVRQVQKLIEVVKEVPAEIQMPIIVQVEKPVEIIVERRVQTERMVEVPIVKYIEVEREPSPLNEIVRLQNIVQVPVEIVVEVERIVQIEKMGEIVEFERIVSVPVETIRQIQKIVYVDRVVEVPVQTIVLLEKTIQVPIERIIEIQRQVQVSKQEQVGDSCQIVVEKVIEVEKPVYVDRVVEKQVIIEVQKLFPVIVETPIEIVIERTVEIEKQVESEPCEIVVERTIEKVEYVDRIIEKPVDRVVEKIVIVETPVEIFVEKKVEVEKVVQKVIYLDKMAEVENVIFVKVPLIDERTLQSPMVIERPSSDLFSSKFVQKSPESQNPKQKQKVVEVLVEVICIPLQIPVQIPKVVPVQVQRIREVQKMVDIGSVITQNSCFAECSSVEEKMIEIDRPADKIVEVEKIVYVDRPVDRVIERVVENIIVVETPVEIVIQKLKEVEKIVTVIKEIEVEKEVIKPVEVVIEKVEFVQREVEVVRQVPFQTIREVVVEKQVEKIKQVIVEKVVEVVREVEVQKRVEVEKEVIVTVEVPKEVVVQKIVTVEVPRETVVDRIVPIQVPVEIVFQKLVTVEVLKQVIVPVQVPQLVMIDNLVTVEVPKEIVVEKTITIEIPKEIFIDRRVQVPKEILIEKTVTVEIPRQVIVEKTVEVEVTKEVTIEKVVEVPKEIVVYVQVPQVIIIDNLVTVEVPKEVIVQRIVKVEVPKEVVKEVVRQVIVEKPVEIIKEVIIQKEVFIERERGREFAEFQGHPKQEELRLNFADNPNTGGSGGVLLSDREEQFGHQDAFAMRDMPLSENYELKEKEVGWQQQKQQLIQRYAQNQKRMEQEMRYIRDEFMLANQKIEELKQEKKGLAKDIKAMKLEYEAFKSKNSAEKRIQLEKDLKAVQTELAGRQKQREVELSKLKELSQTVLNLKSELRQQKSSYRSLQERMFELQKAKENEVSQFLRQIEIITEQLNDLVNVNQQIQDELELSKEKEEKLISEKSAIEEQLVQVRGFLQERSQEDSMKKQEEEYNYKEALQKTERIYKAQIEELIKKNYQIVYQKDQEISELDGMVKELQTEIGKANDYITKFESGDFIKEAVKSKDQKTLIEQNQSLKGEVTLLSQRVAAYEQELKKQGQSQVGGSGLRPYSFSQKESEGSVIRNQKSRIKIEEVSKIYEQEQEEDIYIRMNKLVNDYSRQLEKKDRELDKMKELLCMYEAVIEDMQREQGGPFQNRSYLAAGQGIYRQSALNESKMQLDANVYVSNLLRKIALLQEQVRFEKGEKLRMSVRVRQLQRAFEEINIRQANQSYQDDSQLIERLVYQLEREKDKSEQFRLQKEALLDDLHKMRSELQMLKNSSNILRNNNNSSRAYSGVLQELDDEYERDLIGDQAALRYYKTFKVKYIKCLELVQLIKKEVTALEMRVSKNCTEIVDNIKRFVKIIENNEKNSAGAPQPQKNRLSRAERAGKIEVRRQSRESEELVREMKKIDSSLQYDEDRMQSQWRQARNRLVDLTLDNLIQKNPPRQVKYLVSLRLVEFGLDLLQQREIENLCPEKIFVMHFNAANTDSMRLTLARKQKPKEKVRLYQAPQILVGQPESAKSYSWSIGLMIDKLFHGRLFFQKFGDILDHKDNFQFQDRECRDIGEVVQQMVIKNKEHRLPLQAAREQIAALLR